MLVAADVTMKLLAKQIILSHVREKRANTTSGSECWTLSRMRLFDSEY